MQQYRALSLDGCSSWAAYQAMALQEIYGPDVRGHEVLKQFHLVGATGGGCFTLAGLVMNKRLSDILKDFFFNHAWRQGIFAGRRRFRTPKGKISTLKKLEAIERTLADLGKRPLSAIHTHILEHAGLSPDFLVGAFDCDRRRVEFFRSSTNSRSASSKGATPLPFAQLIHAATTSPAHLFDEPAEIEDTRFWDGAAGGLHNPIVAVVTEALANGARAADVCVLSIGTGTRQLPVWQGTGNKSLMHDKASVTHDLAKIARNMFDDPSESATFVAHVMLGQILPDAANPPPVFGSVVRMNPVIRPVRDVRSNEWVAPKGFSGESFQRLANLPKNTVDEQDFELVKRYGELWTKGLVDNQTIRASRDFRCEIGHDRFPAARDAWRKLVGQPLPVSRLPTPPAALLSPTSMPAGTSTSALAPQPVT
jgi:hypothetical protein